MQATPRTAEMGLMNITKQPRVYFANNYPVREALQAWRQGTYPGQHLWGTMALEAAGYEVVYSNFGRGQSALERVSRSIRGRAGNLAQEAEALRSHANVYYVADPRSLHLLPQRRCVAPIVAIVHPTAPSPEQLSTYKAVGRYREVLCHSKYVYEEVLRIPGRSASNTSLLPWGPDLLFPGYAKYEDGGFVVAVGKTGRDYPVLRQATQREKIPLRVHEGPQRPYVELLPDLQHAAVIAIPLQDPSAMNGLTELNDALALSKPVVMTRSPTSLDVDIEAIGCGIWVDLGDVDGWRRALSQLMSDAALRDRMGEAGRKFAEQGWNQRSYGARVVEIVDRARQVTS
jgi:hypothetical protein